jgi:hypothetical protein
LAAAADEPPREGFDVAELDHDGRIRTSQLAVLGDFEAQLLGVELERLVLAVDEELDQRDSFHGLLF